MPDQPPPAVRRISEALVNQALARCDREGIAWEDFYAALLVERALPPKVSTEVLFQRVFVRLHAGAS